MIAFRVPAGGTSALLLFAALLAAPVELPGQQPDSIDASLIWAITAGGWGRGDVVGRHRVLVYCGGFEHVSCEVFVQWIRDPSDSEHGAQLVASQPVRPVNDSFVWSVDQPQFLRARGGVTIVQLRMGNSYDTDSKERTCTLRLGPPGQMAVACRPE